MAGTAAGQGVLADGSTYTGPYNASTISGHSWKVGPGVAPQATLYSFKVFGCEGSTDLTVDAINAAVAAHVDVINMSLGSPLGEPSPDDPSSVASDNAVKAGVVVVASAGNSGPNAYVHGSPAAATGVISAAALDALPTFPAATVSLTSGDIPGINMNAATLPVTATLDAITASPDDPQARLRRGRLRGLHAPAASRSSSAACAPSSTRAPSPRRRAHRRSSSSTATTRIPEHLPAFLGASPSFFTIPMIGTDKTPKAALIAADGQSATLSSGGIISNPTYKNTADFSSGGPRERRQRPQAGRLRARCLDLLGLRRERDRAPRP